jgi:hypothetical protein
VRRADLADLTAFVAVADNLSFRAAASHIGVTPSALSRTDAAARGHHPWRTFIADLRDKVAAN